MRQKYFIPKELRYSIAFIIISSLVAGVFIIYLAKAVGGLLDEQGSLPIILIMLSYGIIVIIFTLIFAHRFIGPFERLKMEVRLIRSGNYDRRLRIRGRDDLYIKSFLDEINLLLEECQRIHSTKGDFAKEIDAELMGLLAMMEKGECTKERLMEALLLFRDKVRSITGKTGP